MVIGFCKKCKSMMMPSGNGRVRCRKCQYEEKGNSDLKLERKNEIKEIVIIENDETTLPTTERTCDRCGNEKAYFWIIQTRASDEPPTRFFRCTKCKHTWREYS